MCDESCGGDWGCGCSDGLDRREFLTLASLAAGTAGLPAAAADAAVTKPSSPPASASKPRGPASVRVVFLYVPSKTFSDDPDGWWSWPGNDFDAEGRQRLYTEKFREMEKRLGLKLSIDQQPVASAADASALARQLETQTPDGLLLVMFYNRSLGQAETLLAAAEKLKLPAIFYIGLGVKHGRIDMYRRPGVYFIQSLENFAALEYGLRMIHARRRMAQGKLLSITEAPAERQVTEAFFGTTIKTIPFARYAAEFQRVVPGAEGKAFIQRITAGAKEQRDIVPVALENAARAHLALKKLLADEAADGLTMNCLRRGMLKPCMSFSQLNAALVPAACENDLPAVCGQFLGQLLLGRPGFQHNPCYDTEKNHYYGSHCTCPTRMQGPDGPSWPFLLRRFAHTNEGSCAIQVFWEPGQPVTMIHYYPGVQPALDIYSGKVVASHPMPPAAGCTTNVEIEITDRPDACMVRGHHNLLFCGDDARKFRLFAQLFRMRDSVKS